MYSAAYAEKAFSSRCVIGPGAEAPGRPIARPSISPTPSRQRLVEEMKTSSAANKSSGRSACSTIGTLVSGPISSRMARVTPSRHPELSGGVSTLPPRTQKIFAAVHSATSPRSLSSTTSSTPCCCASPRLHTFTSHDEAQQQGFDEVVLLNERGE